VTIVSEEDILTFSNGGYSNQTAFWVIYIDNSELVKQRELSLYDLVNQNSYFKLIDNNLL
jgi:hypothetical protein